MNTINPFKGLNTYQESDSELFLDVVQKPELYLNKFLQGKAL